MQIQDITTKETEVKKENNEETQVSLSKRKFVNNPGMLLEQKWNDRIK
jgi:hypothetical protein